MCAVCMLYACNLHANNLVLDSAFSKWSNYISWGKISVTCVQVQSEYLCDIVYVVFLTCIKKVMFLACNLHVHACYLYIASVTCAAHITLNLTTCMLVL